MAGDLDISDTYIPIAPEPGEAMCCDGERGNCGMVADRMCKKASVAHRESDGRPLATGEKRSRKYPRIKAT